MAKSQTIESLLRRKGLVRSRDIEREGISRSELKRLNERGVVERVARGIYGLSGAVLTEHHSLAEAARLIPGGVICLLTALRFHGLTTQNPFEVWMAIEAKAWRPKHQRLKLRLVHFSGASFHEGLEEHDVGGVRIRVYSAAKTVADCFKFRNKIGIDVAIEALKDFTRQHRGGANDLARFARICRVSRVMQPYLDAIS
ncbi:MAG TPA: type IV toxin-antitoxin system AbiEi family antitoxin domain-containing protein [Thermoanaerobaculia bacterium]|jgi:predicted transcriptional regulator of viral defense system|nr:type IV toxin-antitoxin system AbiEi family antitoxin domain-containing protein [Thermoanaerobaculia bacterium]